MNQIENHSNEQPITKQPSLHSVKVPKLYKEAAKAFENVQQGGGLKSALYSAKHPNVKALTALVSEALRNDAQLDILLTKGKIREDEPRLSIPLAKILITELIWGKKRLGGDAKPMQTIRKYEDKFHSILKRLERKNRRSNNSLAFSSTERNVKRKPRYVRVNTLLGSTAEVIVSLLYDGWNEINPPGNYLDEIQEFQFCKDPIVENLLVFPPSTEFHSHPLYLNGTLILQDKSSCLPALALKPRRGRSVIDACAAPGMKTSLLAALMQNEGHILAIEKSEKRVEVLQQMKERLGLTCVEILHSDFTDINPSEHPDVEYILLDPSCSGSGMVGRIDHQIQPEDKLKHQDRLDSLFFYQKRLIRHAMKFPGVKRIVYSTCSTYSYENEDVIAYALLQNNTFVLKNTLPAWPHRLNNPKYEWASRCVTADYDHDQTDGFFVALLQKSKIDS